MEASKGGLRCGVCKRTELEGERFSPCPFCGRAFCSSHMAIHELGCLSKPRAKPAEEHRPARQGTGRKVAAVLVTILVVGSAFAFVSYPGATQELQGAIGNAVSYLSSHIGQQAQGSGSGSQTAQPQSIDAQWVASFISAVNSHRSTDLTESSTLDDFAALRFNTLSANYEVTHYGFDQDANSFFSEATIQVAEEYFYPNLGPSAYAQLIQTSFSAHWEGLVDPTYTHFGYYVGRGPANMRTGPCSAPLETLGVINETQQLIQYNCRFSVLTETYVVIELSD